MLENRMIEEDYIEKYNNYEEYLEYLNEEDDRRYEDEIFERMSEE
jgi:hypothetical protein